MTSVEVKAQGDTVQIVLGPGEKSRKYKGDTVTYPRFDGLVLDNYNRTITFADGEVWQVPYFEERKGWDQGKLYPLVEKLHNKLLPFCFFSEEVEKQYATWSEEYYNSGFHSLKSKECKEFHAKMQPHYDLKDARSDANDLLCEVSNLMRCEEGWVPRDCSQLQVGDEDETGVVLSVRPTNNFGSRDVVYRLPDGTEKEVFLSGGWGTKVKKKTN